MKEFLVPNIYRSELISKIKSYRRSNDRLKKDFAPTVLDFGGLQIFLARHFGFCYGVENAIEIAFKTIENNTGKRIYLLSEMIHNPQVNADLESRGVRFLQDTYGKQLIDFDTLTSEDIVIVPAFGTTLQIEELLTSKGIEIKKYNTTCPFVEKVWNRSEQIAKKGYSIVVHGKPKHEETRATFSHASSYTPTVVINDFAEAERLAKYIVGSEDRTKFYEEFKGRFSPNFDVNIDLDRIGVVNQTTQLASDTQQIADYLKQTIKENFQLTDSEIGYHFAETRDTLCYATNDNQTAVSAMLEVDADLAIVVGGYNSSNTSHLVEMCETKFATYFINNADKIMSAHEINHCNWKSKAEVTTSAFIPSNKQPVKVLITSGASCPDAVVEDVIVRLLEVIPHERELEDIEHMY